MKKNTALKIIAILCTCTIFLPMLSTVLSAVEFEYVYEEPIDPTRWEEVDFDTDFEYSIAFVGDTQYITSGDRFLGTQKLKQQFKYIAETAEERKLKHVFVLGDLTDNGFRNDRNLGGAANAPTVTKEWEIVQEAYLQLSDADISFSLCRGNHDDYMMDDYFNIPAYTDQFKGCGGFFSDSDAKHPQNSEPDNNGGYIYWSAKSGYHENSIVNSWKTMKIGDVKYLFVTVDYNPTDDVLDWLDGLLAAYPDHRAIVTTHAYLAGNGSVIVDDSVNTKYHMGNQPVVLWNSVLKNHPNVFMIVSGHVGATDIVYSYNEGTYGNKVLQLLVDPQNYDTYESDSNGTIVHGIQDTGLVLYMNFSKDGNFISLNYYSTLLDKFLKGNKITFSVNTEKSAVEWKPQQFDTDHAYSLAFVGDTQNITCGDYFMGTDKLEKQFKYIADTAEERKLEHVFVLGDMTDLSYLNDPSLSNGVVSAPETKEWEIVKDAVMQLADKGVSYSICRGERDDYMINDYFNIPKYTDQYKGTGGFFSDTSAKYTNGREVYWSAKSGVQKNAIVNSFRTLEIHGTKYLFITIDYDPTDAVLEWVDQKLAEYPDHRAIITTHAYLDSTGSAISAGDEETASNFGNIGEALWNKVLKKHANVFMIVSGHKGSTNLVYSYNRGDKGNKVLQVLVDPELYDVKEIDGKGNVSGGVQDVGLVLYMNFSEDGNTISFNYYSTLLGGMIRNNDYVIRMDEEINCDGDIDLSSLEKFGQVTPVITDKKTPILDGVVNDGEYSANKVTDRFELGVDAIRSNLTEYFAYDDDYIYYAIVANTDTLPYKLSIHLGDSKFTFDEIENGAHNKNVVITFGKDYCLQYSNNIGSKMIENKDIFCKVAYDKQEKRAAYELKIRRGYFAENNVSDDVLAYAVDFGSGNYRFELQREENDYLKSLGLNKSLSWTYHYVYFGAEHLPATETDPIDETTELPTTKPSVAEKNGCGSTLAAAPILLIAVVASVGVTVCKNKKDDRN